MGLDMYLHRVTTDEVGYWRKAHAIFNWIQDHCCNGDTENCRPYEIQKEQLVELKEICEKVVAASKIVAKPVKVNAYDFDKHEYVVKEVMKNVIEDPAVAKELLPEPYGNYDEWYLAQAKSTIPQIANILAETDFEEEHIEYYAWW